MFVKNLEIDQILLLEMFMVVFVLIYVAEEVTELVITKTNYLRDGWNLVDWANLSLLIMFLIYRIRMLLLFAVVLDDLPNPETFTDLSPAVFYMNQCKAINAFNMVLVCLKVIKYLSYIPYIVTLVVTIRNSWKFFVSYFVLLAATFVGFSLSWNVGFGSEFAVFQTLEKSILFVAQTFIGGVGLGFIYTSSPQLGGVLIILFITVIYFMMLNLFFGIMVSAFSEAKILMCMRDQSKLQFHQFTSQLSNWFQTIVVQQYFYRPLIRVLSIISPKALHWYENRQRKKFLHQAERDKEMLALKKANAIEVIPGGPAGEYGGRKQKAKKQKDGDVAELVPVESSSDSEPDLGPLTSSEIARRKLEKLQGRKNATSAPLLTLEAVATIVKGLANRGDIVNGNVIGEFCGLREILISTSTCLEVLNGRFKDLEKQQTQFNTQM